MTNKGEKIMRKTFPFLFFFIIFTLPGMAAAPDMPGLDKGVRAPDFEALNHQGKTVRLSDFYKQGPVVLVFYRGGWCYYCNLQLRELQKFYGEFKKLNTSIVAVSVDKVEKAAEAVQDKQLSFDVISNPRADILEAWGLTFVVPDDTAKMYKEKYGIDLHAASGRDDNMIAVPAAYIIDTTGKIVYAFASRDYKIRPKTMDILAEVKKLTNQREF
jgi:peroxiredoxin